MATEQSVTDMNIQALEMIIVDFRARIVDHELNKHRLRLLMMDPISREIHFPAYVWECYQIRYWKLAVTVAWYQRLNIIREHIYGLAS